MAKRWYFSFKTLQQKTCTVNIYDRTYSGAAIELTQNNPTAPGYPAASPLDIDEDDSQDLLEVLRTKTGYINLIETSPNSLKDMYAKTSNQFDVEVIYDGVTIFKGYVQAQSFETDYMEPHHKVSLPIMSYMEYLRDIQMDASTFEDTMTVTCGEIFENQFSLYDYIIIPNIETEDDYDDECHPLRIGLYSSRISPVNSDYNFGILVDGVEPPVYSPITYGEFIEAYCHLFGFICHDVGSMLLFTKYDFDGNYIKIETAEASQPEDYTTVVGSSATTVALTDIFQLMSNKNKRSDAESLAKIAINYEKPEVPYNIDFSVAKYAAFDSTEDVAVLDFKGIRLNSDYWNISGGSLPYNKVRIAGDGKKEFMEVNFSNNNVNMFKIGVEAPAPSNWYNRLKIKMEGDNLLPLRIYVYSDGMYYDYYGEEGDIWKPTPIYHDFTPDQNGEIYVPVGCYHKSISVWVRTANTAYTLKVKFTEISFVWDSLSSNITQRYLQYDSGHKVISGDSGSSMNGEIMNVFYYFHTGGVPELRYQYLKKSQTELKLIMRPLTAIDHLLLYIYKMQVFSETGIWRVISYDFSAIDDAYTLHLMRGEY